MNIIIGGTGQVGSATARALLRHGEPATILSRNAAHAAALKAEGATIVEADIRDVERLRDLFAGATRAFLLNPPADPATDTDAEALQGAALEKIVLASTYGARPASGAATSRCSMNSSSSSQHCLFPSPSIVARIT